MFTFNNSPTQEDNENEISQPEVISTLAQRSTLKRFECADAQANQTVRSTVPITNECLSRLEDSLSNMEKIKENFSKRTEPTRIHHPYKRYSKLLLDGKQRKWYKKNTVRKFISTFNYTPVKILYPMLILLIFDPSPLNHIFVMSEATEVTTPSISPAASDSDPQSIAGGTSCFGGLQTFEKISMSSFENPATAFSSSNSFGGTLIQQDDQALTSECVYLCKSQSNCLSFVIDYNKFECKSYATTQQELQQELNARYQTAKSVNSSLNIGTEQASASTLNFQHLLPSASSNYFEKICLEGIANRDQFNDVCGQGRLWTIERVVDSFLDGFVEKEVTNVNNKDECSKLCIFEGQFVCRSADYDYNSRLCRLSKEDRRTQPQAMRYVQGSNRQYLENQCATPGPSSCVYETKKNTGIISMDALKFAQTVQDCQMKCNQELTFNCRSYSFHQQRCFLSGDDSSSLNSNLIKLPMKQGWLFGEKKCLVELCTKGIFSYEKITGYTLRSALSTPIDLMMPSSSSGSFKMTALGNNLDDLEKLQQESSQVKLQQYLPVFTTRASNQNPSTVSTMMMLASNSNSLSTIDPMHESASSLRPQRISNNNLAITSHCRHSCDLGYLNCPAFTVDFKNNRCQRLDRNSQGRHHELVPRDGHSYYEKICLRVPEIMSMCQDKYWIFERVLGYELAPRFYEKSLKFVQSRRDCQEYCLEEKQFQCRSALYNDEVSECKLSRYNRRLVTQDGGYYRNFNARISYLENQCIRDHGAEKAQHCIYEQVKDEPSYPTYTEHIEMVPSLEPSTTLEMESADQTHRRSNLTISSRQGSSYCEQLCNDNAKFECHSFGYYASTAQCFLSGDDSISAGESATTPSSGFSYYEQKCHLKPLGGDGNNHSSIEEMTDEGPRGSTTQSTEAPSTNPYFQPSHRPINPSVTEVNLDRPTISNNNISIHIDQKLNMFPPNKLKPSIANESSVEPDHYKCGIGHTFVYQRISGFEPIGGFLTLLIKNDERPGIVSDCAELCKRAYECRAFVIDYNSNQCYAMLENSSVGLLSLRQTLGKDYFEGFCVADHILLTGSACKNKTWVMDKIVDQAVIGVQHQKLIQDTDRTLCRQACLEERLFWCKTAMFDSATGECKLYSIERESMPQMRLLFTKGVDFFENQCQIMSNSCPYDAIERDISIVAITKSTQARSTFDCELACNQEQSFNCRSYTYMDQYPSLPNLCLLSSDSRSTSQKGSVREHHHTLYAERNCYFRRPRYPSGSSLQSTPYSPPVTSIEEVSQPQEENRPYYNEQPSYEGYNRPKLSELGGTPTPVNEVIPAPNLGCEPHQFTFERTFGYDFKLGHRERAPITSTIGVAIGCQQECLRRGERCQSFVVEYGLPYQNCILIENQVGSNKRLLVKSSNAAYFEKICLPRTGIDFEQLAQVTPAPNNQPDTHNLDIAPSYSNEPWTPQVAAPVQQLPYYLQLQQLAQNYPSRSCAKLWSFERFINHNFTVPSDKKLENILSRSICETHCINEASFNCKAATYDYTNKLCRLFKSTRRTIMSQFVDLDSSAGTITSNQVASNLPNSQPGVAHILTGESEILQVAQSSSIGSAYTDSSKRQASSRQITSIPSEISTMIRNIDYMENTCAPEPSSCQYRQLYDLLNPFIDKINHAVSLNDCQRQCDLERLFSCKSINYDPASRNCMLINEDLISLNRGQQNSLIPKKNSIYSEKGNCEMISVQCNSQEMLVAINFDSPFRGRIMAKGNPEQCFLIGDGQTNIQFPIVFGPKCNSRQEGHNTFINEVVIQQHPVIMTESDKTVRVMCAFEAPEQTITLKNPSSRDNKTGIDVGTPEMSRTRHDKQHPSPVISNKAFPPSVVLRIMDQNGRDASMINLGDDLVLKIQMQVDGENSALGIFARNLAARSSSGESLLLIDNDGCPVDHLVFPALEIDPKDGKSLYSNFKAFRFPSSGLVNFEVQIRFCPEKCQPVDCNKGQKTRSFGRKKRDTGSEMAINGRTSIIQSLNSPQYIDNPLDSLSTVMKPGKAFQYVRELFLLPQTGVTSETPTKIESLAANQSIDINANQNDNAPDDPGNGFPDPASVVSIESGTTLTNRDSKSNGEGQNSIQFNEFELKGEKQDNPITRTNSYQHKNNNDDSNVQVPFQKSILMHVDEKVVPSGEYMNQARGLNPSLSAAPYGRFHLPDIESHIKYQNFLSSLNQSSTRSVMDRDAGKEQFMRSPELNQEPITKPITTDLPDSRFNGQSDYASVRHQLDASSNSQPNTSSNDDETITKDTSSKTSKQSFQQSEKESGRDLPLRFSILVGENPPGDRWIPREPNSVVVMNSSNQNLDHIVVPGREGQLEHSTTSDLNNYKNSDHYSTTQSTLPANQMNYQSNDISANSESNRETSKRSTVYEQTFDALPSNSIVAEVPINQRSSQFIAINKAKQNDSPSETAASYGCRSEPGSSRLWTIIWTGTFVIALNICLVVLSLLLYFRKVHLRQNHDIMRATSECGTHSSTSGSRWPSVLLKSKNNLGTSLNTHEHFFCKLNSKPNINSGLGGRGELNWPNLSSSSSHSTISSMAGPMPVTSIRINQTRPLRTTFDPESSLSRSNLTTNAHKSILEENDFDSGRNKLHASYLSNIDRL